MNRYLRRKRAELTFLPPDSRFDDAAFQAAHARFTKWDVLIERSGASFRLTCHTEALRARQVHKFVAHRTLPYVYYMMRAGAEADVLLVDASDGDRPALAEAGPCFLSSDRLLVPDVYFFETQGFAKQREQRRANDVPWQARSGRIVWRGTLTGHGLRIGTAQHTGNGLVNQRLRLALACLGTELDVKFAALHDSNHAKPALEAQGVMGDRIAAETWLNHKYAIDIDGYSNAWDNLYHRLLFGCCVLKVESQVGFRQWYYHRLRPYEHFVPIKADLSDLHEQVDWVRSHPTEAEAIARAGSDLAHSMTFESEAQSAAQEILALCKARTTAMPTSAP